MSKVKRFFKDFEKNACVLLLAAILIILTYQVMARYILKTTPSWSEELSRYLFIWVIFLGASYAAQAASHIRIETLNKAWPRAMRKPIMLIGTIVWIIFNLVILYSSGVYTYKIFVSKQISIGVNINMGWAYLAIPVGYALMIIRITTNLFTGKELIMPTPEELAEDIGIPTKYNDEKESE